MSRTLVLLGLILLLALFIAMLTAILLLIAVALLLVAVEWVQMPGALVAAEPTRPLVLGILVGLGASRARRSWPSRAKVAARLSSRLDQPRRRS